MAFIYPQKILLQVERVLIVHFKRKETIGNKEEMLWKGSFPFLHQREDPRCYAK